MDESTSERTFMALNWRCGKGHEFHALAAPAACPNCGDTFVQSTAPSVADFLKTIDLPARSAERVPTDFGVKSEEIREQLKGLLDTPQDSRLAVNVKGYEILGELGRGGMGVVYKARQMMLNRIVALKMILTAEHAGPAERQRFRTEGEAVAQLQHPHIVQIYDVGEAEGRPYFSLEFVDGGSLAQKLAGQPQNARASAILVESLARAVAIAHAAGIVHRDLKPANVLLSNTINGSDVHGSLSSLSLRAAHPFGIPKITDFGLAKRLEGGSGATQSGSILGTPSYMAPEQAAGNIKEIGPTTDIYALGAILYEMLTGRPPFHDDSPFETIMQVIRDEPVAPSSLIPKVPLDLEIICLKCLEKNPIKRYATALELADDLRRFIEGDPISARSATKVERVRKWIRRHPAATGFIILSLVGIAAMVGGAWIYHGELQVALASTKRERDKLDDEQRRTQERTVHLMVSNGMSHVNQGDYLRSLPWFTEALRGERNGPAHDEMHRIRIASIFRECPRLTRGWFHNGKVNDASFSPDGTTILSGCQDGAARVFQIADVSSDDPLLVLQHPASVTRAIYSPDGKHIATVCSDRAARLWDVKTGKTIGEPMRHAGDITSITFSPDSLRLVTTSADRTARVWDVLTAEQSPILFKHSGTVNDAAFSPDGRRLATAGADGAARVWDIDTGKPISPVLLHQASVVHAFFSPDGKSVLTASQDTTARVWDAATGEGLTPYIQRGTPITDAGFSPGGQDIVTSCTDGVARVYNLAKREARPYTLRHDSSIVDVSISPDGRYLATGGDDNTARVWDKATGLPVTPPLRHNGTVHLVTFSADGASLLTTSLDGLVRLWDLVGNRHADAVAIRPEPQRETVYGPDRRRMLKIVDNSATIIDTGSGEPVGEPLKHSLPITVASFSPDSKRVLTASADRTARVWDAATGSPIGATMRHGSGVTCAVFSPDGRLIVTGSSDNTARVWNAGTGEGVTPPLRHLAAVLRAMFSPDGRCILTYSGAGVVRIWDASNGESLAPGLKPSGWTAEVLAGSGSVGWDLPPDQRPIERLTLLARWLSAHTLDTSGNLIPLDSERLREVFDQIRAEFAEELRRRDDTVPWHRQEAEYSERAADWFAVVFHLTKLIDQMPKVNGPIMGSLCARRARALAELGQWKEAARDYRLAVQADANDDTLLINSALTSLAAGEMPEYAEACQTLVERCAESANTDAACRMAWICLLCPQTAIDLKKLDDLTERVGRDAKPTPWTQIVHGARLMRASKLEEAITLLEEGQILAESVDAPRGWMMLALAEQRAGRAEAAKRWQRQVTLWQERGPAPAGWQTPLEFRVLAGEWAGLPAEPKKKP